MSARPLSPSPTTIPVFLNFQLIKINIMHIIKDKNWFETRATVLLLFEIAAGKESSFMP
jgi:hypothetical protein